MMEHATLIFLLASSPQPWPQIKRAAEHSQEAMQVLTACPNLEKSPPSAGAGGARSVLQSLFAERI